MGLKNTLKISYNKTYIDLSLLVLRVGSSLLMLTHGLPKLNKLMLGGEISFPDPIGLGATFSLVLAVFSEVICSFLILIGLATRLASVPLLITMLVAALIVHSNDGVKGQELSLMYAFIFFVLMLAGSGRFSVDKLIK